MMTEPYTVGSARRRLFRRWAPLAAAVLALGLLQILLGRFADAEPLALLWLALHLLPASALLYASIWLNRYPEKMISGTALRALMQLCAAYLAALLLTLLLIPIALRLNAWGHIRYLAYSYGWLALLHLPVLAGIYMLFVRKQNKLLPNRDLILQFAENEQTKALSRQQPRRARCLETISNGDLFLAFSETRAAFQGRTEDIGHIAVLENRYRDVTEKLRLQVLDEREGQIALNQITLALINLSENLDA